MKGDFVLINWQIKKVSNATCERDLYCADTPYSGNEIFEFSDGTTKYSENCLTLTKHGIIKFLFNRLLTLEEKYRPKLSQSKENNLF